MNSALIASESTVRKRSFMCRIGAPRVARRGGPGLLFAVVVGLRRRDFRRRARHAVRAREPPRQVDRPAARRAEGERLVLLLRFHPRAAIWTAWHACLLKGGGVGFNKRGSGQPQDGRLTAWRYHFMTAAMMAERARERVVLVVDDDPDILQTLALCLSTEGYEVLMASNGQEALEVLRRQKPACILLDLMMPVMDGWQFVSEMEQRGWRKAPLLILSADRAVQGHATRLHAEAYLAKPFDLDELLGKVSALTGGPDGHGQAAKRLA